MLKICNLERLCLWDNHSDISIYLEWASDNLGVHGKFIRFVIFAMHPQVFFFPWGQKYASRQNRLMVIAHQLAGLTYKDGFYQELHWSFINRFPKLSHYPRQQTLARNALTSVMAAKGLDPSLMQAPGGTGILYRPGSWNARRAAKRILSKGDNNSFLLSDQPPPVRQLLCSQEPRTSCNSEVTNASAFRENPTTHPQEQGTPLVEVLTQPIPGSKTG